MKRIIDIPEEVVTAIQNGQDYRYDIHTAIAQSTPYEERSQGEWEITEETDEFYGRVLKCTHCNKEVLGCGCRNFCTWCGAAMRKEK